MESTLKEMAIRLLERGSNSNRFAKSSIAIYNYMANDLRNWDTFTESEFYNLVKELNRIIDTEELY